ncbi:MAG: NAD(P)-binding domain-containing protein, partial [Thermoanaerobaculia bacterium]
MKRIGIIGLGSMGLAMAKNIIDSGFELTGFDLRQESLRLLEAAGGKPAGSAADVGANADVVFVMVLNGSQVREVVAGENGLLENMKPGSTIIVSATIDPAE